MHNLAVIINKEAGFPTEEMKNNYLKSIKFKL